LPNSDEHLEWFDLEQLLRMHGRVIAETGGSDGVLKLAALEYALERPLTAFGGVELFPTLCLKAAAIAHSIVTTHPFVDGNKRTALVAASVLLALNGLCLAAEEEETVAVMLELAQSQFTLEQLAEWLDRRSTPIE
jgi:death on curing protein